MIWLSENVALISRGAEADPVVERVIVDVTERHRLYGEIRRARRIEAVAQLAGAAVQEFRNILNSTMEYSSFALQTLDEHDPRRARAEQIREMVNRAGSLAQQLSEVIQGQRPEPAGLDANEALGEMTSVLRLLAGDDVSLRLKPGVEIGPVAIERSKFEQVLTALVVSARDCLPAGGTVSVELSTREADPAAASHSCLLLTVCSEGYDVLLPQRTSALDHLVASCQGHLQTGGKSGNDACYKLFLPLIA
jgi:signal transduction histidine kinase